MKKRKSSYSEEQQKSEDSLYSSTHEKAELGIIKVLVSNDEDARSLIKENLNVNQIKNPKLNKFSGNITKSKRGESCRNYFFF